MYGDYKGQDELAVIFSAKHSDFKDMTFEEAKKIAGKTILSSNFKTSTFGQESRFGIIDVTRLKKTCEFNLFSGKSNENYNPITIVKLKNGSEVPQQ